MAECQLPKIRPLGKLEEIAAAAHHIDFFTNCAISAHYRASEALPNLHLELLVFNALSKVLRQHPILFAIPVVPDTEQSWWGRLESVDLKQVVSFVQRTQPLPAGAQADSELDSLLEYWHNTNFKGSYGTLPVWRLVIFQDYDRKNGFMACFVYHHSICDGTGSQIFQDSFQKALCDVSSAFMEMSTERIVFSNGDTISSPLEDLHPLPLVESPPAPDTAGLNEWKGSPVTIPCKTRYKSLSFSPKVFQSFAQNCKKNKTTVTAALSALVAKLLYDNLPSTTDALTCNLPVSLHSDLPPTQVDGVMGNFVDSFKVQLLRSDLEQISENGTTIWKHAKKVQEATRRYFANVSLSGEPYVNVAIFKLIPDVKAFLAGAVGSTRGESFEVSNLGNFPEPKNLKGDGSPFWRRGKLLLSRSAFAPGAPFIVCVIENEDSVGFGFIWQADVVESVVDGLRRYLSS